MLMEKQNRELTGGEKRRIRKLVTSLYANYDKEYSCLPLDSKCYMFGICYTNSAMCKYFHNAVLPNDTKLEAVFTHTLNRINDYRISELKVLYETFMNFSTKGGKLSMVKSEANNYDSYITRRIGSTTYKVKGGFSNTERETLEDKFLQIIRNEAVTNCETCNMINSPQMSRQSERSA